MRVIPGCNAFLAELEHCLSSCFLPALFGVEVSVAERQLFSLPFRMGCLGLSNPEAIF